MGIGPYSSFIFWPTVSKTVPPYAIGPLSVLCVCLSVLSLTLVYCGQTVGWLKIKLGVQVGLGPGHIMLDGDPALPPQQGHNSQFSAHFYCGQTAGCTKMPLGMELGLSPADFVLDGDTAPPQKGGGAPQIFGPCLLCPLGMEVGPSSNYEHYFTVIASYHFWYVKEELESTSLFRLIDSQKTKYYFVTTFLSKVSLEFSMLTTF